MKKILLTIVLLFPLFALFAQTTVFFQGFENAALTCAENWGYTNVLNAGGAVQPNRVATNAKTGTNSFRFGGGSTAGGCTGGTNCITGGATTASGCSMHGNTFNMNTVNIAGLSNVQLTCHHGTHQPGCNGTGFDTGEGVDFQVSLNGAAFFNVLSIRCTNDARWNYLGTQSGNVGFTVTTTADPNVVSNFPLRYNVPAGTNTVQFRVISIINRTDEIFYVDDISLSTTSTLNPGIWTGTMDTDWFNCINWQDKVVPTASTAVTIDQTALRNCVIGLAAGSAAVCQSLTHSSNSATTNDLTIQNASSLTVGGNVLVSKTAGSGVVTIEMLGGSTLSCTNLSLTGTASAAENAELKIENAASTVNVSGNFTNNQGGTLDMSTGGPATGTLNLSGAWTGNGLESDFKESGSNVNLIGAGFQTINTNNYTEVFHNLTINKAANPVLLLDDIEIDATGILNLTNDQLALNSRIVTIQNPAANAIQQTASGSIVSETIDNLSRVRWNIGTSAGAHIFPFARGLSGIYIPFSFTVTSGDAGMVTLATYGTAADNLPWPAGPVDVVNNLSSTIGLSPDNRDATVDRFWQIDVTGTPTATLSFSYAAVELPTAPYNDPFSLVAQRYETSTDRWQAPLPGQAAALNTVTVSGVTTFSPWTLSVVTSILPVEILKFEAEAEGSTTLLNWATASETNNDYFLVERSNDGIYFEGIGQVKGAGTYEGRSDYQFTDKTPNNGINYYRLKMLDFDGSFSYSEIAAVSFDKNYALTIFPNPLSGNRILNINSSEKIEKVRIVNALGQELLLLEQPEAQLSLPSFWAAGFYTVLLETSNATIMRKLVIE